VSDPKSDAPECWQGLWSPPKNKNPTGKSCSAKGSGYRSCKRSTNQGSRYESLDWNTAKRLVGFHMRGRKTSTSRKAARERMEILWRVEEGVLRARKSRKVGSSQVKRGDTTRDGGTTNKIWKKNKHGEKKETVGHYRKAVGQPSSTTPGEGIRKSRVQGFEAKQKGGRGEKDETNTQGPMELRKGEGAGCLGRVKKNCDPCQNFSRQRGVGLPLSLCRIQKK